MAIEVRRRWRLLVGTITWENLSCILPKCVMHVTNDQFSDKFNNGWKKCENGRFIEIFRQ